MERPRIRIFTPCLTSFSLILMIIYILHRFLSSHTSLFYHTLFDYTKVFSLRQLLRNLQESIRGHEPFTDSSLNIFFQHVCSRPSNYNNNYNKSSWGVINRLFLGTLGLSVRTQQFFVCLIPRTSPLCFGLIPRSGRRSPRRGRR